MKNLINFEIVPIKKIAGLNQFSFIALLFSLFLCQNIAFAQSTDIDKKTSELNMESDKVNVDLKDLQKIAEYPGGLEKFYSKIVENFDNSEMDYDGFTKISVSFVIEKNGTMSDIVINDPTISNNMKKSIIRMIKSIKTKWSPAIKNDQPVRTGYDLPIVFNAN